MRHFKNKPRIEDILEEHVDEKYYLPQKHIDRMTFKELPTSPYDKPPKIYQIGELSTPTRKNSSRFRTYDIRGIAPTLVTSGGGGLQAHIMQKDKRIRRMTPKEYWRATGISDTDFDKAENILSNSQLYNRAGNAIVVNVLESIFENILKGDKNMTLRVFEAFAGIGTQHMALRNIGADYDVVAIAEVDEYAILSYDAIHTADKPIEEKTHEEMTAYLEKLNIPMTKKGARKKLNKPKTKALYEASVRSRNLGDVSQIEPTEVPDHDLFTYSFPCFTGDTLVLTDSGYKRIDEINIGDKVLTHTNQYKKVTNIFNQGVKNIINVKGMAIHNIKTTENHKFLTRERHRVWNNDRRSYDRLFHEPQWVEAKDLTKNHYLGLSINQNSELPAWDGYANSWGAGYGDRTYHTNFISPLLENNNFWWLMGRYVADGWCRKQGGIVVAVPDVKLEEFENRVNGLFDYNISKERTANKVHIPIKELSLFTEQFGYYAHGKKISPEVLNLPVELLKSFIEGYFSGDGSYSETNKLYKCTTTSEELVYGIGQCIAKVYHRPYSIYKENRPATSVIEGRTVNQRDTYSLTFKMTTGKQDKAFYEDGHIWFPFNGLENDSKETVYDIEVEDDHSFTVFNTIVHNCQDISVAGKGKGFGKGSGTRSGLLWECEKVIRAKKPKYLLMENVKNLISKKFKPGFEEWLTALEELGYTNYWQVLNAKDYGIPQNRERVFCVSILGEHEPYKFPEKEVLELRLKDVLEDEVDEKYYLDNDKANKLIATVSSKYEIKESTPTDGGLKKPEPREVANTVMARYDSGVSNRQSTGTMVIEPKAEQKNGKLSVGYIPGPNGTQHQSNTVYHTESVSPSVNATDYKNPIKVTIENEDTEPKAERIGGIFDSDGEKHQAGAVWDKEQVSPTLNTMQGGWQQPSVLIKNGTKRGYLEATDGDGVDLAFPNSTQRRGRVQKDLAQTLDTSDSKGVVVSSSDIRPINPLKGKTNNGWHFEQQVYDKNGITRAVKAGGGSGNIPKTIEVAQTSDTSDSEGAVKEPLGTLAAQNSSAFGPGYIEGLSKTLRANKDDTSVLYSNLRIRKLTPKECWRLMGTTDEDFAKAASVNSNSQLYKQAGNAIVVDVLERIFDNMTFAE